MREAIERARARGEARDDLDAEYFRTLFGHASMSLKNTKQIVDYIARLIEPHNQTGRSYPQ
jgi:hypothetical protein